MEEPMVRGHVLEHVARYYRSTYDHPTAARVEGELSIELKTTLESVAKPGWYPRRHLVELLRAFAAARGAGDAAYGDFVRCGRTLAEADNDFARLLMKLMTPELFVKKLPRFWSRDHVASGAFEIAPSSNGESVARITLRNVKNYDHGAILWLGFMQRVLEQLGTRQAAVMQQGWSWVSPGPQDVSYEVRWS